MRAKRITGKYKRQRLFIPLLLCSLLFIAYAIVFGLNNDNRILSSKHAHLLTNQLYEDNLSQRHQVIQSLRTSRHKKSNPDNSSFSPTSEDHNHRTSSTGIYQNEWNSIFTSSYYHTLTPLNSTETRSLTTNKRGHHNKTVCQFPGQDAFHPQIMRHFTAYPTLNCSHGMPSIAKQSGDVISIDKPKVRKLKIKYDYCRLIFFEMATGSDFKFKESDPSPKFVLSIRYPKDKEFFLVLCYYNDTIIAKSYITIIRMKTKIETKRKNDYIAHVAHNSPKETLSVLLVGIDGLSRQCLIRSMKETRKFVLEKLKGIEFYKFNKVGDNTFPNIVPLLAGMSKSEISKSWTEKARKRSMDSVDHYFVWNEFQKAGYRTAMVLDRTDVTAFHYQKKGWSHPNFDYYNRAMVLKVEKDKNQSDDFRCIGQETEISFLLDNLLQLATVFNNSKSKPYFAFSFLNRMTHESANRASQGDQFYAQFLKRLYQDNLLNNTVLILFSDHGPRFGRMRHTFQGILESRTPFLFFVFPHWFRKKYPKVMQSLSTNQHRLTTAFDVHQTLLELINFTGYTREGDINRRGISLFNEIPKERNCNQSGIPEDLCMCTGFTDTTPSSALSNELAKALLTKIVFLTRIVRTKCLILYLSSIEMVASVNSQDKNTGQVYRLIIVTKPNRAVYEGMIRWDNSESKWIVVGTPVRLNLYRGQAECVQSPDLRPFCHCK